MMKKNDIYKEFKEKADLANLKDAKRIWEVVWEMALSHMKDEGGFQPCMGFKLFCKHKDEHNARNPFTGEVIKVPSKLLPKAKFGESWRTAVNE